MTALKKIPSDHEIQILIGAQAYSVWKRFCSEISTLYDMECQWNDGGKKWEYEYKFRRGCKTLCALYAKQDCFGCMIIFGKDEREQVEKKRNSLSSHTMEIYDKATTYHDGKWVMFDHKLPVDDLKSLLAIKRKPNRK
ncbi:MAG: DUF3788 domain-containing protein [Planctomycetia bacterium]|nr:DUF3788 domain-containing protein [Planctomycetia bacterium]